MAVLPISSQYKYKGRGPFDAKALVKTYADLLSVDTWTVDNILVAYNGMITAVWLNKEDTSKNGIYFLFDVAVTTALKKPDVTNEANWHKLMELSDISEISSRLSSMESELTGVKAKLATIEENQVVLRRDNEYNFKTKNDVPKATEICIVDVAGKGVRVKIGDGSSTFTDLPYLDDYVLKSVDGIIVKGYLFQNQFYADVAHEELLESLAGRIYIDAASSRLYTYNGIAYEAYKTSLPNASAEVAGVVKLYDTVGNNTDGTMTQKAITEELDEKVEMSVNKADEMLILDTDLF
jgi:hypothetical protein